MYALYVCLKTSTAHQRAQHTKKTIILLTPSLELNLKPCNTKRIRALHNDGRAAPQVGRRAIFTRKQAPQVGPHCRYPYICVSLSVSPTYVSHFRYLLHMCLTVGISYIYVSLSVSTTYVSHCPRAGMFGPILVGLVRHPTVNAEGKQTMSLDDMSWGAVGQVSFYVYVPQQAPRQCMCLSSLSLYVSIFSAHVCVYLHCPCMR